ncbi:Hypothetical predicted protein [Paramuricea clavata]|uniref:Uncharacterized protein n=1 Tax=Paramuricea clavata TaxID=317549 RepID=A0A6S7I6J7_PARCT|nr:Hypothetical predicted protein [Paramuricea clavata]
MDKAKEEAGGDSKGGGTRTDNRRNNRGFNTGKRARGCVVDNCPEDHPPWVITVEDVLELCPAVLMVARVTLIVGIYTSLTEILRITKVITVIPRMELNNQTKMRTLLVLPLQPIKSIKCP